MQPEQVNSLAIKKLNIIGIEPYLFSVTRAVGVNFIPYRDVQYNNASIEFSAASTNPRAVFGLLLAIDHSAR